MIGRTLSHYRIDAQIGAGGMGVVYRARDLHLERDVALKVLPQDLLADDEARSRFRREALALSRLPHAHITTVHDYDVQEQTQFLVMELVPGRTLAETLTHAPLPEHEVVRLGLQIAGALQIAHEAGVLHRDLKPANIMVTPKGEAKVMDFGLARRFGPASELSATVTATAPGMLTGTLAYLAPELLMGQEASVQSDLYALGVALYEMATGRRPHGETQAFALANAIMNQEVPAPRTLRPELSAALEAIVLKCLARDPAARYASAQALIADLEAPVEATAAQAAARRQAARRRSKVAFAVMGAALVLVSLLGVATVLDLGGLRSRLFGARPIRSIAVLPLANLSNDPEQEYFADAMTDELITALAQVRDLSVISRSSAMSYKNTRKPLRQIARELNVQAVLEGSVRRSGNEVRINAQLVDARSDRHLWAQSYQRGMAEILGLQNAVVLAVAEQVKATISPQQRARLSEPRKVDPAAHEAYLKGRFYVSRSMGEGGKAAIEHLQRAIEIDPTYAAAYAGLADAYAQVSASYQHPAEAMPRSRDAASRALDLDPDLAAAHASLAYVRGFYDWQWAEAEAGFRRAIELNPSEPMAHMNLGYLLVVTRRFEEGIRELRRARDIDPASHQVQFMQLWPHFEGRQYDRAVREAEALLRDNPDFGAPYLVLGQGRFFSGDRDGGIRDLRKGYQLTRHPVFLAWEAFAHGSMGNRDQALALYGQLQQMTDTSYVQPYFFALMHTALGEKDPAFSWLDRAVRDRAEELVYLQVDPGMDSLRSDPRFDALLKKVGFEP